MNEEWRALPRFNGLLEVSSIGRVRTLDRAGGTRGIGAQTVRGRVLKFKTHPWGYYWCEFMLRRVRHAEFAHRLVAEAFHGPAPPDKPYACHGDNNPKNNVPENLRWGSPSDNSQDKWQHGTQPHGEKIWWSKVDTSEVLALRDMRAAGMKIKDLAAFFSISQAQVCRIATGKQWAATEGAVPSVRKKTRFLTLTERCQVLADRSLGLSITKLSLKYRVSRTQIHNLVREL